MAKAYTGNDIILGTAADPVRFSFTHIDKPRPPKKPRADGTMGQATYQNTFLLDPTNKAHAAMIQQIGAEAKALCEKAGVNLKALRDKCYGRGNDLAKVYDGYANMVYLKAKEKEKPLIFNRRREEVGPGEPGFPYSGCWGIGKVSLWLYTNESIGIAANLKVVQFVKNGEAFGRPAETGDEFEALPDDGSEGVTSSEGVDDDWM